MKSVSRTFARTAQRGFTMIELIVVIVILGILASVALPRFTNMQRDARIAKLNAARGAIAAASGMVHGAALSRQGAGNRACPAGGTENVSAAGGGSVCTENGLVTLTNLYPAGSMPGIVAAAGLMPGNTAPSTALLRNEGYNVTAAGGVVTVQALGSPIAASCQFTYTAPTISGAAPAITQPVTTGC